MTARLRRRLWLALALFCSLALPDIGSADPVPDPALWGGGLVNPNSGLTFVPLLFYDEVLDELYINTLGVNQTNNTGSNNLLLGDDGLPFSTFVNGLVTPTSIPLIGQSLGGLIYSGHYLNGQLQIVGFLTPGPYSPLPTTLVARYPEGTTCGDFVSAEMVPSFGNPGFPGTLFGGVQCVPEPTAILTTLFAGVVVMNLARLRPLRRSAP